MPLADCEIMTLIFGLGILLLTLPGALVWLASRKKDAVKTSNRRRSPSGATFRARWLREVGGAGNNFGAGARYRHVDAMAVLLDDLLPECSDDTRVLFCLACFDEGENVEPTSISTRGRVC